VSSPFKVQSAKLLISKESIFAILYTLMLLRPFEFKSRVADRCTQTKYLDEAEGPDLALVSTVHGQLT